MKQVGSRKVWTIAEVAGAVFRRIEDVPSVWIEAEVTNLSRRGSQVYLTLVDHGADQPFQIDASMNAVLFDRLSVRPGDGSLVHVYGRVEMWVARSQLRFRIERLEPTGDGLLLARIDELRRRLQSEGLTADERKRPLPFLPRRIGLITSGEGAARHDFLTNVTTRFPGAAVVVVSTLVQGDAAPAELVRAIRYLDRQPEVDVVVLARGGGALEDLMAFNSEAVCRAVAECVTPVVSAVGHESDVTVCDLVADVRVSTPTKAAEAVVPDAKELNARLDRAAERLRRGLTAQAASFDRRVQDLAKRMVVGLSHHGRVAGALVDGASARMARALGRHGARSEEAIGALQGDLVKAVERHLTRRRDEVERLAAIHNVLSPARTVARGYAIVRAEARIVSTVDGVAVGDRLEIEVSDGRIGADVVTKGVRT